MPPKRLSTTVRPRRATFVALLTSSSVKDRPDARGQSLTISIPGDVPDTPVDQFRFPYTIWAVPPNTGATSATAGQSFAIDSASSMVRVG